MAQLTTQGTFISGKPLPSASISEARSVFGEKFRIGKFGIQNVDIFSHLSEDICEHFQVTLVLSTGDQQFIARPPTAALPSGRGSHDDSGQTRQSHVKADGLQPERRR